MPRRLMGNDVRQERATQQRLTSRIANARAGTIQRAIRQAMQAAADRYVEEGRIGIAPAIEDQRGNIEQVVRAMYSAAWDTLGGRVLRAAKSLHGNDWIAKQSDDPDERHAEALREFIASHAAKRVGMIQNTSSDQVRRIIEKATQEGEGVEEIAKRVRKSAQDMSRVRSEVIARTETHNAGQAAQDAAARAGGVAQRKEWVASIDDRTRDDRFSHVDADREIVRLDEVFTNTGEEMRYPGDPRGSGGNTIMCRCGTAHIVD